MDNPQAGFENARRLRCDFISCFEGGVYTVKEEEKQIYQDYIDRITPVHNFWLQLCNAFVCGGIICVIGQLIMNVAVSMGQDMDTAGTICSIILILISAFLTGFNLYPSIVKWGGAGALVPITGFANSVAAPAIENQVQGQVFGIGATIFTIAGPVILYGVLSSWVLGLIYWLTLL